MKFLPYEDVPLRLSDGNQSQYIFAENASLSINQPTETVRQINDNMLSICSFNNNGNLNYTSPNFNTSSTYHALLGPKNGPPQPLASSIHKIAKDTPVYFPNEKKLYFKYDTYSDGNTYIVDLYSKDNSWSLSIDEAQNGYFDPIFKTIPSGPAVGSLDVNFYFDSPNLQNFFNITGLFDLSDHPPINERNVAGNLGNFGFERAFLNKLSFSLSPNSISQASASFDIYGEINYDESLTESYFNSADQDYSMHTSIAHSQNSQIIGTSSFDMNYPIACSYSITCSRNANFQVPSSSNIDSQRSLMSVPKRVSNTNTVVNMTVEGEHLNPDILSIDKGSKYAELNVILKDLDYQLHQDNSNGFIHSFGCFGTITSESLSVDSQGYLAGSISVSQTLR